MLLLFCLYLFFVDKNIAPSTHFRRNCSSIFCKLTIFFKPGGRYCFFSIGIENKSFWYFSTFPYWHYPWTSLSTPVSFIYHHLPLSSDSLIWALYNKYVILPAIPWRIYPNLILLNIKIIRYKIIISKLKSALEPVVIENSSRPFRSQFQFYHRRDGQTCRIFHPSGTRLLQNCHKLSVCLNIDSSFWFNCCFKCNFLKIKLWISVA